jgi:O-acetyl-ADP-ribose deacetylase (regulator of RNase III)
VRWVVKHCDILDEPADVLVCSANPYLNLSGGVGGALLLRYGDELQRQLHEYLTDRGLHFVRRGEVVLMPPCGSPYRAILHAVAVDAFYDTSAEVVASLVSRSLEIAASLSASKVALTAIATGYGRLSLADFARAIGPLANAEFPPVDEVAVCLENADDANELARCLWPDPRHAVPGLFPGTLKRPPEP